MLERLRAFQEKRLSKSYPTAVAFYNAIRTDSQLKKEVKALARYFLNKTPTGCRDSIGDLAYELERLNTNNPENMEETYRVRQGTFLYDPINHSPSLTLTVNNITEEKALYHLAVNPAARAFFTHLPSDWEERLEKFKIERGLAKAPEKEEEAPKVSEAHEEELSETAEPDTMETAIAELKEEGLSKTKAVEHVYANREGTPAAGLTKAQIKELVYRVYEA